MQSYSLTHVSDAILLRELAALVARDRFSTATLLAHIGEVDARRLHVAAGCASMHAYCVEELRLSEDAAFRRIRAARAARQFPALFIAVAEGRLHLAAVSLLAPHLTAENAAELIKASTNRRKSEVEDLLARRFGPSEVMPAVVRAVPASEPISQLVPGRVGGGSSSKAEAPEGQLVPGRVEDTQGSSAPASRERYILQLGMEKSTHDKLRYAQALLSHSVPSGDVVQVLDRALDALILQLEKRKLGATARSRRRPGRAVGKRCIPAHVRRAVWERDQGRCTFLGASGKRCTARRFLEFDHVDPVARGGKATVDGMRLRCRAHNQYEAERVFGAGFMSRKREEARIEAERRARAKEQTQDILAGLRNLGCRPDEARRAAEHSEALHGVTLEERMRVALSFLGGRSFQRGRASGGVTLHGSS